jgi:hypothetical protein
MRIALWPLLFVVVLAGPSSSRQNQPKLNQTCPRDLSIAQIQKTVAAQ